MPALSPKPRCALTAPFHPYLIPLARAIGGLFSVALSRSSRTVDVIHHRVLWSPDFPPRRIAPQPRPPHARRSGRSAHSGQPRLYGRIDHKSTEFQIWQAFASRQTRKPRIKRMKKDPASGQGIRLRAFQDSCVTRAESEPRKRRKVGNWSSHRGRHPDHPCDPCNPWCLFLNPCAQSFLVALARS